MLATSSFPAGHEVYNGKQLKSSFLAGNELEPSMAKNASSGCSNQGRKSGLVVSKLYSQFEGCGFESHPILDGNGVKTMQGSITAPNPGSFNN